LKKDSEQIKVWEQEVSQLSKERETLHKMREQAVLMRDYIKFLDQQSKLQKDELLHKTKLDKISDNYHQQEQLWITSQASILETHLHEGEDCPVCGSDHHPKKAVSQGEVLTREELNVMKQTVDTQDKAYRTIVANREAVTNQLQEKAE